MKLTLPYRPVSQPELPHRPVSQLELPYRPATKPNLTALQACKLNLDRSLNWSPRMWGGAGPDVIFPVAPSRVLEIPFADSPAVVDGPVRPSEGAGLHFFLAVICFSPRGISAW